MGGVSKWNVLRDTELSNAMPEVFGPIPEVVAGLMQEEAEQIWHSWNPLIWAVIKYRGYLGGHGADLGFTTLHAIPERHGLLRRLFAFHNRPGFLSEIAVLAIGRDLRAPSGRPSGCVAGSPAGRQERGRCRGSRLCRNLVASGAQAACSSGVPWNGFKGCGPGSFLSSAAKAAAPRICIKTMDAQILAYIVSGPIFMHGFTSTAAVPSRSTEEAGYAWSLLRRF